MDGIKRIWEKKVLEILNLPTGVTLNGTGCKICGSEPIACDVIFISKLTGFGPGLETVDVGDSGNLVHS